ncbi:MAG: AMP-binding protein [Betaproteobacteria bacterium]|nr:AMP-binding protein [Betaproteobacteria bacterium]
MTPTPPRMPDRIYPTVVHLLADAARHAPGAEALVFGERRLDYAGYLSCVAGFARELEALGARGERVATLLGNSIEACIGAYGALAAGAQHVPLNPLSAPRELDLMLRDSAPRVLVTDAAFESMLAPLAAAAGVHKVISVGPGHRLLDAWRCDGIAPENLPAPDDLALLQYTGGTTGRPKGVELTHAAISTNVSQREGLLPTREAERILCMMPVSHSYGMAMGLFLAAYCRGTLVLLPRYVPEDVLAAVEHERITVFPGSPTVFTGLMAHARFAQTDWNTVHTCYSGAAPLSEETLRRWRAAVGAPVYEGYGQTEAGPVLSFNPAQGAVRSGSVGVAAPLTEIQIVDIETGERSLAVGERGEIRARGPQIMRGYRNLPGETAQTLRAGWLYTGDIGEFDAAGYLYIRERKKDMLIVGGYNVYPREVEEVLFSHPAVLDTGVVGVNDDYRGELPVAYVVLRPGAGVPEDELLAHCRANLARYKIPARIHIVDALPKTSVAKTDKKALRQWAAESAQTITRKTP